MRVLVGILIALLVITGGWRVWKHWEKVREQEEGAPRLEKVDLQPQDIPGLPGQLEYRLSEARERGSKIFKQFLDTYRSIIKDPRLAWIELDYVTSIAASEPLEAKKLFLEVKNRISTNSVIYPRIRALSKSYE